MAEHYNLRMSDMLSARRARRWRGRGRWRCTSPSSSPRARCPTSAQFGGRDHTTVIHAVRKIEELSAEDSQIAEDLEHIKRKIQA